MERPARAPIDRPMLPQVVWNPGLVPGRQSTWVSATVVLSTGRSPWVVVLRFEITVVPRRHKALVVRSDSGRVPSVENSTGRAKSWGKFATDESDEGSR